jgi:predicted ABC-type transport system involved in lysophospholipase L1 biosynthesis ATPase subunit
MAIQATVSPTPRSHAAPPEAVFRASGLSKVYRMGEVEVYALRSVDLELYRGELVVLLGASGSGKSTLLNILGGLDVPTRGDVWFEDRHLTAADERELTRFRHEHVGFVFQFYNLIPSLTARENVALVTDIADDPMRPEDALAMVGLAERLDHFPAQMSGGEQHPKYPAHNRREGDEHEQQARRTEAVRRAHPRLECRRTCRSAARRNRI